MVTYPSCAEVSGGSMKAQWHHTELKELKQGGSGCFCTGIFTDRDLPVPTEEIRSCDELGLSQPVNVATHYRHRIGVNCDTVLERQ